MEETGIIFSVQESPEDGYEVRALGHSIFTQAHAMDELKLNVREAVHCHFDERQAPLRHSSAYGEGRGYFGLRLPVIFQVTN